MGVKAWGDEGPELVAGERKGQEQPAKPRDLERSDQRIEQIVKDEELIERELMSKGVGLQGALQKIEKTNPNFPGYCSHEEPDQSRPEDPTAKFLEVLEERSLLHISLLRLFLRRLLPLNALTELPNRATDPLSELRKLLGPKKEQGKRDDDQEILTDEHEIPPLSVHKGPGGFPGPLLQRSAPFKPSGKNPPRFEPPR
jgi:hypothetical protein